MISFAMFAGDMRDEPRRRLRRTMFTGPSRNPLPKLWKSSPPPPPPLSLPRAKRSIRFFDGVWGRERMRIRLFREGRGVARRSILRLEGILKSKLAKSRLLIDRIILKTGYHCKSKGDFLCNFGVNSFKLHEMVLYPVIYQ